jgi:ribosomal protein S18 acetylase RimI-like enzyme
MTNSGEKPVPAVTVRAMTAAEYERWSEKSIRSYAQDISDSSGQPFELALERARAEYPVLLPQGLATERTWLLTVLDGGGSSVGILWIGPHPQRADAAYIYDIEIDEQHRGRGLGRAAMTAAEQLVTEAGVTEIGLNVFGVNSSARTLYDSLGYRVVATQMTKTLTGEPG